MERNITRRDFLKSVFVFGASLPFIGRIERFVEVLPNPLQNAVKIPSIEYHDPNFKSVDAIMTPEVFSAQLDWIQKAGYHTPNANETLAFLNGKGLLPIKSVVLRFDLGVDKTDENGKSVWLNTFEMLRQRNLHGLVFLIPEAVDSIVNGLTWVDLAKNIDNGTISICSHGLKDHPDYRHLDKKYALYSMRESKKAIRESLSRVGIDNYSVLGFAFPYDSLPQDPHDLVKEAGYYFFAGGIVRKGENAAHFGDIQKGIPSIYPYVKGKTLESIKENSANNLALVSIKGGESFVNTLITNGNEIRYDTGWDEYCLESGESQYLPETEIVSDRLAPASLIVIHTDSQKSELYGAWSRKNTYFGLNGAKRKIAVTFGVDADGISQFVHLYRRQNCLWTPIPKIDHEGAKGVASAINIEMAGGEYNCLDDDSTPPDKKLVIIRTLMQTAKLATHLIRLSGGKLTLINIVGHSEITTNGKSDPGNTAMEIIRKQVQIELKYRQYGN